MPTGKDRHGERARKNVANALIKIGRPATARELADALDLSLKHVRGVLAVMMKHEEVWRYKPRPGYGVPEAYYYVAERKRDISATFDVWNRSQARCRKTASAMLAAFESCGSTTCKALAEAFGFNRDAARQILERQVEHGRAVKHRGAPGSCKERRGYMLYSPVRRSK